MSYTVHIRKPPEASVWLLNKHLADIFHWSGSVILHVVFVITSHFLAFLAQILLKVTVVLYLRKLL